VSVNKPGRGTPQLNRIFQMLSWPTRVRRFERIALPHLSGVYRVARQMVGDDAAQDLVQETFLRAWKYFHSFDPSTNCRAWLFRILRNEWISRWHKTRLELPLAEEDSGNLEPYYDWEGQILRGEFSPTMEQCLAQLPTEYRLAVLLADVEECSYQEIARIMDCPVGTVMSRLNRGRRMLARLLNQTQAETAGPHAAEDWERRGQK
jgi:RNA polymerase sigma-70 factor (ECF subfamily)